MIVARVAELRTLDDLLAALICGEGGALIVHGEAGIGKTTLLEALAERARGAVTVIPGLRYADRGGARLRRIYRSPEPAVIPIPDERAGELPKAYVVPTQQVGEAGAEIDFVAARVAPHKRIHKVASSTPSPPRRRVRRCAGYSLASDREPG